MPDADGHVTWQELWSQTAEVIGERHVARWLCETASGCDGADFDAILGEFVGERQGIALQNMVGRVLVGEPVQYVMGRWAFRRLDLMVDPRVLIPRPETELIVDVVLGHLRGLDRPATVVDLGAGSGNIGLAVLDESPLGSVTTWLTDVSGDAQNVARANAAGIGRAAAHARFALGDWFGALPDQLRGTVDVVVSNPPYIAHGDPEVDESVLAHEPHGALFADQDGLAHIRTIAAGSTEWLMPGGLLVVEMGHTQAGAVVTIMDEAGLVSVETMSDLAGRDRFTLARRA